MKGYDLAAYVITHHENKGDFISNKKLQKLLYYLEAWSLVYFGSMIEDDFEAWVHGPVIPNVYGSFKHFGASPIIMDFPKETSLSDKLIEYEKVFGIDKEKKELIETVLLKYGAMSSFQLELLSHSEPPWLSARGNLPAHVSCAVKIDKELMKNYYKSLLDNGKTTG